MVSNRGSGSGRVSGDEIVGARLVSHSAPALEELLAPRGPYSESSPPPPPLPLVGEVGYQRLPSPTLHKVDAAPVAAPKALLMPVLTMLGGCNAVGTKFTGFIALSRESIGAPPSPVKPPPPTNPVDDDEPSQPVVVPLRGELLLLF